ncbi:MAG TPA: hypothetical protein PKY29_08630 [Ferruginibacter sp.]|nr:hypothetical protein [Ferruginibacter sp.]HRO18147.1 hypothetical protein [Ferruginibacter sp.]HRQ21367.1 hypothetical protein [Ferruginibacter sp.]
MERVVTLMNKLKEQVSAQAGIDQLLTTVQLLQSELLHLKKTNGADAAPVSTAVQITTPTAPPPVMVQSELELQVSEKSADSRAQEEPEKIIQVLEVNEEAVQAELDEIKRNAETRAQLSTQHKPGFQFDPIEDIPTLLHQQQREEERPTPISKLPVVEESSLNDRLKTVQTELGDTLKDSSIKDLRKAIGLNDRFAFINELFRGDEAMYERSIKTINNFAIYPEAEYWIKRELKLKLGWDETLQVVKDFDQLVRRRFS